jgi:hypothetical protein
MRIPAQVRRVPEGLVRNATVHNASSRGLMISGADLPAAGGLVEVVRGRLVLSGRVVWSATDRCGIHVTDAYDPAALIRGCDLHAGDAAPHPSCGGDAGAPDCGRSFERMLAQLKQAHGELLAATAELGTLLAEDRPDRDLLAEIRLKLMRASRKRSQAIDMVNQDIVGTVSAADRARLESLRAEGAALRAASSKHVADWGLAKAVAHWRAYGTASGAMRASMRLRIMREKQAIYPMLEALSRQSANETRALMAASGR